MRKNFAKYFQIFFTKNTFSLWETIIDIEMFRDFWFNGFKPECGCLRVRNSVGPDFFFKNHIISRLFTPLSTMSDSITIPNVF